MNAIEILKGAFAIVTTNKPFTIESMLLYPNKSYAWQPEAYIVSYIAIIVTLILLIQITLVAYKVFKKFHK